MPVILRLKGLPLSDIKKTIILAVDPGKTGALAFLEHATSTLIEVKDMPLLGKHNNGSGEKKRLRLQLDIYGLSSLIDDYCHKIRYAVIEDVHSMPHDGVASAFSFGKTHGIVIGVLASYNIPIYFVQPSVWKASLGLIGGDKDMSRAKAGNMFKNKRVYFIRKKDHGRAEASLLAHFGKRFWL